jgi:pimeloyl-ACP methyl ester carboxylesterase
MGAPPAVGDAGASAGGAAQGLANSLRGLGQGVQPPLVDRLPSVRMPALLLAGALDAKYAALSREMSRAMPDARRVIVPDAGHAVHLERPQAFQYAVLDFLAVAGGARA